jgi:hypothetical protein
MYRFAVTRLTLIGLIVMSLFISPLYGKDERITTPKELGIYMKTTSGAKRLIPNIVFDHEGLIWIEANNPARFALKDFEYFILHGPYNIDVLTINPLGFFQQSPLGKPRFMFGKNVEFTVQKKGNNVFIIKPKGLLGRGYFCLWIEDTVWDFIIE